MDFLNNRSLTMPDESTRNRLERTLPKITKIALLRGVQFIESLKPDAQAAVDKECDKLPKCASMANDQSQEQKRGHQRGTERREDSSVCHASGHLPVKKNRSWNKDSKNTRDELYSELALWNTILALVQCVQSRVRQQASQMTAAKAVDGAARLSACAGQAADAVSAYTQVIMEDASALLNSPSRNVQILGHVYHGLCGPNLGPALKTQQFLSYKICMDTHLPVFCGETTWRSSLGTRMGESTEMGMPIVSKVYTCLKTWMT